VPCGLTQGSPALRVRPPEDVSWAYEELGDVERARELLEEVLGRARASGNAREMAFALDISSTQARPSLEPFLRERCTGGILGEPEEVR
jgi:FimV-like protein